MINTTDDMTSSATPRERRRSLRRSPSPALAASAGNGQRVWRRKCAQSLAAAVDVSGGSATVRLRYASAVSPTVLRVGGFRFYFFSREEPRAHVHAQHADGEAKFWIAPTVELAGNYGLKASQVAKA